MTDCRPDVDDGAVPVFHGVPRGRLPILVSSRLAAAIEEIHPGIDAAKRFTSMREAFDDALVKNGPSGARSGAFAPEPGPLARPAAPQAH